MTHDLLVLIGPSRTAVVEPEGQACNLRQFKLDLTADKPFDIVTDYRDFPPRFVPPPSQREIYNNQVFPLHIYIDRSGVTPVHISLMSRPIGRILELHLDLVGPPGKNTIQFLFATHQPDILVEGLVALGASVDMPGEEAPHAQDA